MTQGDQPQVGSLSAVIIRACPAHAQCALDCPERPVEDLGEIASFLTVTDKETPQWPHSSHPSEKP